MTSSKLKEAQRMSRWCLVIGMLGVAVLLAGICLVGYSSVQLINEFDFDSAKLIHEPVSFIASKKEAIINAIYLLVPGFSVMLIGTMMATIFSQRHQTIKNEKIAIIKLEDRVEKLEKLLKQSEKLSDKKNR